MVISMQNNVMSADIPICAPVIVPTLCRHEHFSNCIESLSKNGYAKYTDIFIALDYPCSPSHEKGYELINGYLNKISGFKSVNIIRRKNNFGALLNFYRARDEVLSVYDSFIYIDDDLIFSPNFLEFVNKGLDKFKSDKSVFAVSGFAYVDQSVVFCENNFYRQGISLPVYGFGTWKDRVEEFKSVYTRRYAIKKIINPFTLASSLLHSANTFLFLIVSAFKKEKFTDSTCSVYMYFEKKDVIQPVISKVKNMGWDGSGVNCRVDERHSYQTIDKNYCFEFNGTGKECYAQNNKLLLQGMRSYMTITDMLLHIFKMMLFRFSYWASECRLRIIDISNYRKK